MSVGSTKFKNSLNLAPQSADPSSPADGDMFFSDGTSRALGYWQYKDGAWAEFGGGGAGGINFFTDGSVDAEADVGAWVTYADAAGVNPVNGVDGSPTITFAKSVDTSLRGTANFIYIKDAADRQGEGASCPITIDEADQGMKLTFSCDYDCSEVGYLDDEIRFSVYDVTNSVLIRVNGEDLKAGKGRHYFQFQSAIDSTSYRVIAHQSSATTTAYVGLRFDNFQVGPTNIAKQVIQEENEFSAIIANNGTATITSQGGLNKSGDNAIASVNRSSTGVVAITFTTGFFSVAPSVVVTPTAGQGWSVSAGASLTTGVTTYFVDTSAAGLADRDFALTISRQGTDYKDETQTAMSSDLGGREIVVEASGNASTVLVADTTDIDFTETFDTTSSWSGTIFTVPESGFYKTTGSVKVATGSSSRSVDLWVNGVNLYTVGRTSSTDTFLLIADAHYYTKGDLLKFRTNRATTLSNNAQDHWISIIKLASPQTILESETVAARYTSNSGQSITTSNGDLIFEDLEEDTHNAYDTGTGIYTIPLSGWYMIAANVLKDGTSTNRIDIHLEKNGTIVTTGRTNYGSATTNPFETKLVDIRPLVKGDLLQILGDSGVTASMGTDPDYNYFSIARIK